MKRNVPYGPEEISELNRKRRLEEKEKRAEKVRRKDERIAKKIRKDEEKEKKKRGREAKACRGENCSPVWKSSKQWRICPCGAFYVCPKRRKVEANWVVFHRRAQPCMARSGENKEQKMGAQAA